MMMTLNRDHTHVSLMGRSVEFKKGVPAHVPPRMVKEIIAIGGAPCEDQDQEVVANTLAEIGKDAADKDARAPAIRAAISTMIERNQRGDFTAGGRPNLNTLARLTGLTVTAQEMEPIWNELAAALT